MRSLKHPVVSTKAGRVDSSSNDAQDPLAIRVDEAERVSGLDRVTLYRLNAKGKLIFRKAGRRTLVDCHSLRQYLADLPEMRGRSGLRRAERHGQASCPSARIAGYAHMSGQVRAGHSSSGGMASPLSCDDHPKREAPVADEIETATSVRYSHTGALTKRISVRLSGWHITSFSAGPWFSAHVCHVRSFGELADIRERVSRAPHCAVVWRELLPGVDPGLCGRLSDCTDRGDAVTFAAAVGIEFHHLTVTSGQIRRWRLPSSATKASGMRPRRWGSSDSIELDAAEANRLRVLCRSIVETIIANRWLNALRTAEASERELQVRWSRVAQAVHGEGPVREAWAELRQ